MSDRSGSPAGSGGYIERVGSQGALTSQQTIPLPPTKEPLVERAALAEHVIAGRDASDPVIATYKQIAAHFGMVGPNAARSKVKRAGWPAEPSNHPADPLRIRVPRDAWDSEVKTRPERRGRRHREVAPSEGGAAREPALPLPPPLDDPASQTAPDPDTPHIKVLADAVALLREQLERSENRTRDAESRASRAEDRCDYLRAKVETLQEELLVLRAAAASRATAASPDPVHEHDATSQSAPLSQTEPVSQEPVRSPPHRTHDTNARVAALLARRGQTGAVRWWGRFLRWST